jgi:hypothetical protein
LAVQATGFHRPCCATFNRKKSWHEHEGQAAKVTVILAGLTAGFQPPLSAQ